MPALQPAKAWKKRILVPFWIVRILLMILFIATFAYLLHEIKNMEEFEDVTQPAIV
jgi:hypothetical protein